MIQREGIMPGDRLCTILVLAKRRIARENFIIKAHNYELQRTFYRIDEHMRGRSAYRFSILGRDDSGLDEDIRYLQFSGLMTRPDPQYPEILRLNSSAEDYFDKVLKSKFNSRELNNLDRAARLFLDRVILLN